MSGKRKKGLPKQRFRVRLLAFIGLAGILAVIVGTAAGPALAEGGGSNDNFKVFVCKYVGQPGVNERLQTGQNPISVSVNSIPDYQGVGSYFADQHGRSFVLAVDDTPPGPAVDPDVSACPPPDGPDEIPVPTVPVSDPCGPNNAVYGEVPSGNYTVTRNNDGSITLTANEGFVFPGGQTSVTLPAPTDSNEPCPPNVIDVPATPSSEDLCGPNNATWIEPSDTDVLDWELLDNGHLTVTIIPEGTVFTDGTTSHDYGVATDSGEACPPTPVSPTAPVQVDACEPAKGGTFDSYTIPSDANFTYEANDAEAKPGTHPADLTEYVIVAVPNQGVVVKEGAQTEWTFTFSKAVCLIPPEVLAPDGSISVDCKGKGVAVADNSESTTQFGFEVVVNGQATLYPLGAGKVREIKFSGAEPGSVVILQDGEANELDSARVPLKCGGDNPPPDDDNPPPDHPTNPPHAGATSGGYGLDDYLMFSAAGVFAIALLYMFGTRRRRVGEI